MVTDDSVSKLQTVVQELSGALGRPIFLTGRWIVQRCPVCEVELRLMDSIDWRGRLRRELFSFYDEHRCRARANEDTFQRAERASVRAGEQALALAAAGDHELSERAEHESLRLAHWVDTLGRRVA